MWFLVESPGKEKKGQKDWKNPEFEGKKTVFERKDKKSVNRIGPLEASQNIIIYRGEKKDRVYIKKKCYLYPEKKNYITQS